jgi:hypothetical protein
VSSALRSSKLSLTMRFVSLRNSYHVDRYRIYLPRRNNEKWLCEMRFLLLGGYFSLDCRGAHHMNASESSVEAKAFVLSRNIGTRHGSQVATANLGLTEVPSCPSMSGILYTYS